MKPSCYNMIVSHVLFSMMAETRFHTDYLPAEGVVALLVFLLREDECFDKGRVRSGVSGSDRLLHDFLTPSRSLTCQYTKRKEVRIITYY